MHVPTPASPAAVAPLAYSIEGALNVIPIGRTKFYELLDSGEIFSIKVGRRRLIPHHALEAFLARGDAA